MTYFILYLLSLLNNLFHAGIEYQISDREKAVNKQMEYSAQILSQKYHFRPCATSVAMPEGDIQYLELKFEIIGPLSQKEIRKILISSAHDFLENINNDKQLCSYLHAGRLDIQEIGIGLFFIDATGYPIEDKLEIDMASIRKGVLRYCRSDPNEISISGIKISEESYQEALSVLHNECTAVQKRCNDSLKESVKLDKNQ